MVIEVPEHAERIINRLTEKGFQAYAVGGCIRDSVLGRKPDDWDITTSAKPWQVKELFGRTVDTGLAHGTVTVLLGGQGYEVTTYRIDGEYEDNRHPKEVQFTQDLLEDLKRRDFTVNAMAYNSRDGLIDAFGGMKDIQDKIIRCVGDPRERFQEDALRMLRAVRFSAQLGFDIDEGTKEGISLLAPNLASISPERIQVELVKLAVSPHPKALREAWQTGMTRVFLPEFDEMMETPQLNPHHQFTVGEHTLEAMEQVPSEKILRLTMLFHDIGKPSVRTRDANGRDHFKGHEREGEKIANRILRRLRFDNDTIQKVTKLVRWHDVHWEPAPANIRRAAYRIGQELFPYWIQVQTADVMAQSLYRREEKLERIRQTEEIYRRIQQEGQCVSLHTLAVSGKDLIGCGMKPGKEIGETLSRLLELVLEDPEKNTKEYLISCVYSWLSQ